MTRQHVGPVAHAKQHRAAIAVFVFVHFAGWMHYEGAGRDRDGFFRCAHDAAAGKTEIDSGREGMTMIWTDLARLPASHGDVAVRNLAQNLLDVVLGVPLLLAFEAKDVHAICSRGLVLPMKLS